MAKPLAAAGEPPPLLPCASLLLPLPPSPLPLLLPLCSPPPPPLLLPPEPQLDMMASTRATAVQAARMASS